MLIGSALVVIGTMSLALPLEPVTVVAFRVLAGVGTAMWGLSRHAFITQATDTANRGRSIAVFGGINRIGMFAGPAIGGIVATAASTSASFLLAGVMGLARVHCRGPLHPTRRESAAASVGHRGTCAGTWSETHAARELAAT